MKKVLIYPGKFPAPLGRNPGPGLCPGVNTGLLLLIALFVINCAMAQWTVLSSDTTNHLKSVCFTNANIGYVVGNSGTIIKTSDGGATWESLSSGTSNDLTSVYFTDINTGYVVGNLAYSLWFSASPLMPQIWIGTKTKDDGARKNYASFFSCG